MSHALSSQLPLNQGCEKLAGDLFFWQSHENSLVDRLGPGNKRHKNWDMDRIRTPYGTWYCMVQWCSHQDCPFNPRHFNDALGCESKVVSTVTLPSGSGIWESCQSILIKPQIRGKWSGVDQVDDACHGCQLRILGLLNLTSSPNQHGSNTMQYARNWWLSGCCNPTDVPGGAAKKDQDLCDAHHMYRL